MSGFKSDAQRKHFFVNNGAGSTSVSVTPVPVVGPGQYVHSILVCGGVRHVVCEESDRLTREENFAISDKEDRKANDMQAISGGNSDVGSGFVRMSSDEILDRNRFNNDGRIFDR